MLAYKPGADDQDRMRATLEAAAANVPDRDRAKEQAERLQAIVDGKPIEREFFKSADKTKLQNHLRNRATLVAKDGGEIVRIVAKVGRNRPCPCGSGRKFKKCCLHRAEDIDGVHPRYEPTNPQAQLHNADEPTSEPATA